MNNEDTIYMGANSQNANAAQGGNVAKPVNTGWKRVTIGGVSGVLLGAAGAFAANQVMSGDGAESEDIDMAALTGEHKMATTVTDDMTFEQAFDAARAEVGPGGMFTWNGHVYGTFTVEEWNAMPIDAQKSYFDDVNDLQAANEPTPVEHVHHHHTVYENHYTQVNQTIEAQEDSDVKVLGTEWFVDEDGNMRTLTGVEVDGHRGVVLGGKDPSDADVAVIDMDDNGHISHPDVVIDMHTGESARVGDIVVETMATGEAPTAPDGAIYVSDDVQPIDDGIQNADDVMPVSDDVNVYEDVVAPEPEMPEAVPEPEPMPEPEPYDASVYEASNDAPADDMAYDVPVYDA